MKILFVSSECSSLASTGGLGDVSAALPKALLEHGVDVERVLPLYRQVVEKTVIHDSGIQCLILLGDREYEVEFWDCEAQGVHTWLVKYDPFFDREHLYGDGNEDYKDNAARYILFQKAVVALLDVLGQPFDVLHLNDWHTGLIPHLLEQEQTKKVGTVFGIHNLAYQGVFPEDIFHMTGLPKTVFEERLMHHGQLNMMKAGLTGADVLITVSPHYAKEIQTPESGCGLARIIHKRSDRLKGILNGVDYSVWNPEDDPYLVANYSKEDLSGKALCKQDVLEAFGLPFMGRHVPLFGLISRMVEQKGMEFILSVIPALIDEAVQFVVLGSGENKYEQAFLDLLAKRPENVGVTLGYDVALSHKVEAGSDMYLMPSKFEPCGLNQLYSLKYGAVPIVAPTGGLLDSVSSVIEHEKGTGYVLPDYSVDALLKIARLAIKKYRNIPDEWRDIQRRGMSQCFSWTFSAGKYLDEYKALCKR